MNEFFQHLNPFPGFKPPLGFSSSQPQPRTQSSLQYQNYPYQPSKNSLPIAKYTPPYPEVHFEATSSLEHLANFAAAEPPIHSTVIRPEAQFSKPVSSTHVPQGIGSASLRDVDCWDYSWAAPPDPLEIEFVRNRGRIPLSCLRILLAKNVAKHDGLILIGPSYMEKWLSLSDEEKPTLPMLFDQSSLGARTQMILVPWCYVSSVVALFAVSRSALGTSPVYFYFFGPAFQPETGLRSFFCWLLQKSQPFQQLYSPRPEEEVSAGIHLILNSMALADFHSSGQLPQTIVIGQDPIDIISFRDRALIQLTSESKLPGNHLEDAPQQESRKHIGDSVSFGKTGSFRIVEFENGVLRKRRKQDREPPPRRSGPLSKIAIAEAREVRKRGGACKRCKKLKKKCDGNEPCNQCKKLNRSKTSKWVEPCVREHSHTIQPRKEVLELHVDEEIQNFAIGDQQEGEARAASTSMFEESTAVVEVVRNDSPAFSETTIDDLYDQLNLALDESDEDYQKVERNMERIIKLIIASNPAVTFDKDVDHNVLLFSVERNYFMIASLLLGNGGGPLLQIKDAEGSQPIHRAVEDGDIDFVKLFLDRGASITTPDGGGRCPLHISINQRMVEISQLLVENLMTLIDDDLQTARWTELHRAIMRDDEVEVRNILKPDNDFDFDFTNSRDSAGWSILKWAAWKGNPVIFKVLVQAGADLDSGDYFRFLPKSTKIVQTLIDAGFPINEIDDRGGSPLYRAISARNASVASLLLRFGADPLLDKENNLLCTATVNNLTGILQMLLECKLPVNGHGHANGTGRATPLEHAIEASEVESVRILLKYGADPCLGSPDGLPIHYAAREGSTAIFKQLLKSPKIDCEAKGRKGETTMAIALSITLSNKFFCMAKLLGYDGNMDGCECRCCKGLEEDVDFLSPYDLYSPLEMTEELWLSVEIEDMDTTHKLLRLGVLINARKPGDSKDTALHIAARKGNEAIVTMLLDAGADYQAVNGRRMSPLLEAIQSGEPPVVAILLAAGSNVNIITDQGKTALILAVEKGQVDCVQLILQEEDTDVNLLDRDGCSALSYAIKFESQPILDLLLRFPGIDINSLGSSMTPLQEAICSSNKKALEALLKAGSDPNKKGTDHAAMIPLVMAAGTRDANLLEILLASPKTDINIKDSEYGQTALMEASAGTWAKESVLLLSQHPDIDINATDSYGCTALIHASELGRSSIVDILLRQPGIDANKANHKLSTALIQAITFGFLDVVEALLQFPDIKVNTIDQYKQNALFKAVGSGNLSIVNLLLQFPGIQVNAIDRYGENALFMAVRRRDIDIVTVLLLSPSIDVNAIGLSRHTALIEAACLQHFEIVTLLLNHPNVNVNSKDYFGYSALTLLDGKLVGGSRIIDAIRKHPKFDPKA